MASVKPLKPGALYKRCDLGQLAFDTTLDLERLDEIVGQDRAVEAVRFGIGIRQQGYNMFALGPTGTGKFTLVRRFLEERAIEGSVPSDLCYVHNFEVAHRPKALLLPAGRGAPFRKDMARLLEVLRVAIPAAFESEDYRTRKQALAEKFKEKQERAFTAIEEEARTIGIALIRTPVGVGLAPVRDGEILGPDDFNKLPQEERDRTKADMPLLEKKLKNALLEAPRWERELQEKLKELSRDVTNYAVGNLIDDLRKRYEELPKVQAHLDAVHEDLIENVDAFLNPEAASGDSLADPAPRQGTGVPTAFRPYQVNLLVDHGGTEGAPVIYEDHPNLQNLIGRIEHLSQFGTLLTDFKLIKPGALHRANGGYLILDARKVLTSPAAWEELKRALRSREIRIESLGQILSIVSTVSIEPEPVPLEVKVVLTGDRMLYYLLCNYDPDFQELFKVTVDFEEEVDRRPETMQLYARVIADIARNDSLKPFDRAAVARVIEHGSRLAGDAEKISTHMRSLADLLSESDYLAGHNGKPVVTATDVEEAIEAQIRRADRIRERSYEQITRNTVLIDTQGEVVGQVNGLAVIQLGQFSFGRPSRITARVRLGRGRVVDIEREVELGGPIHSKGVLILSAFLGARYSLEQPLSLSASLVFEQSYGGVEGDSASSAELYALLSALAEVPVRQSLAVTGSVNQLGQVQAIGGANEKIEGFFDICASGGLTGGQGVLIPASNVKHLMLRKDVVDAVAEGKFHVWPVSTVDEGIELLTGMKAGGRGKNGKFPKDSVNGRIEARLVRFAEKARAFARHRPGDEEGE